MNPGFRFASSGLPAGGKRSDIGPGTMEARMTFAGMNYWAVVMAAVAAWMLGALWDSVLAKPWIAPPGVGNAGMQENMSPPRAFLPFVIAFVAALVMAWGLAGIMGHLGPVPIQNGGISGA